MRKTDEHDGYECDCDRVNDPVEKLCAWCRDRVNDKREHEAEEFQRLTLLDAVEDMERDRKKVLRDLKPEDILSLMMSIRAVGKDQLNVISNSTVDRIVEEIISLRAQIIYNGHLWAEQKSQAMTFYADNQQLRKDALASLQARLVSELYKGEG